MRKPRQIQANVTFWHQLERWGTEMEMDGVCGHGVLSAALRSAKRAWVRA